MSKVSVTYIRIMWCGKTFRIYSNCKRDEIIYMIMYIHICRPLYCLCCCAGVWLHIEEWDGERIALYLSVYVSFSLIISKRLRRRRSIIPLRHPYNNNNNNNVHTTDAPQTSADDNMFSHTDFESHSIRVCFVSSNDGSDVDGVQSGRIARFSMTTKKCL